MSRINIQNLVKQYGGEDVFSGLSFEVLPGMRLAVAGPNGCGKSTLLRVLAGQVEPDGGFVGVDKGARIGYVAQELSEQDLDCNLLSWVMSALPSWNELWVEWERAVAADDKHQMNALAHKQADFEEKYGYNPEHRARAILTGLGFSHDDLFKKLRELSGGWRERSKLARVLLQGADVLLLDEPTNHLDLEAVEWLEQYLMNFKGALVFVAHDRIFLNRVGTHVLFVTAGRGVVRRGSFDEYLEWEEETSRQKEREMEKLSARIEHENSYIRRFRVKARKAAQAQSKIKKVEKMETELAKMKDSQALTRAGKQLGFRLPEPHRGDKVVISATDLHFSYGDREIWTGLNFQLYRGKKVALLAPNGAGKSTMLKLLVGELQPTSGSVKMGGNTTLAYFSQHQTEILNADGTVLSEIRRLSDPNLTEEQLMSVLGLFLLGERYFERKVSMLSGGEKSRLVLATLFLARANLLILDEPTNHLDIESREGLISALKDYEGTLLFVAHDRYLLQEVAEDVWHLSENGLEEILGGYERFVEKKNSWQAEEQKDSPEDRQDKRRLSKDEKRKLAEARNQLYRELKPYKAEYEKLEKELEPVLEDQAELEKVLHDPATYEKPELALKANAEYREAEERAEAIMERMAELEMVMEEINAKRVELGLEDA